MGPIPSAVDTRVYFVADDGTEHEIHGVTRITWTVACDNEPARATLEIGGVEIDAEALVRLGSLCGHPAAPGEWCELPLGHIGPCGRGSRVPKP